MLDNIATLYQSKIKNNRCRDINKLMNIFRAQKKSIFIEKCNKKDMFGIGSGIF
jgi:hypothetical protein